MRDRELHRLFARHLLTELAGFIQFQNMVVKVPVDHHACAVIFETSAYERHFVTTRAFVQPLYVPTDSITLTYGVELGHGWRFEPEMVNDTMRAIREEILVRGLPHFHRLATPERFAGAHSGRSASISNLWHAGCAWVRAGDVRRGRETLERLLRKGAKVWDDRIAWQREKRGNVELLLETLRSSGLAPAQSILDDWEGQTRAAVGLDELAADSAG